MPSAILGPTGKGRLLQLKELSFTIHSLLDHESSIMGEIQSGLQGVFMAQMGKLFQIPVFPLTRNPLGMLWKPF